MTCSFCTGNFTKLQARWQCLQYVDFQAFYVLATGWHMCVCTPSLPNRMQELYCISFSTVTALEHTQATLADMWLCTLSLGLVHNLGTGLLPGRCSPSYYHSNSIATELCWSSCGLN